MKFYRKTALLLCSLLQHLVGASAIAQTPQSPTLEQILTAHQMAVDSIHTIDAQIDVIGKSGQLSEQFRWTADDKRQRMRRKDPSGKSAIQTFSDWYWDGSRLNNISGIDPTKPLKPFKVTDRPPAHAFSRPIQVAEPMLMWHSRLLLHFSLLPSDMDRTLTELVADARQHDPNAVSLLGLEEDDGANTFHIKVIHPGVVDPTTGPAVTKS